MLIGITGTSGAGKGALIEYLVSTKGFSRYSARAVILEEIRARHLPETRATMRDVANDLRRTHGSAYVIERLYELAKDDAKAIVESVHTIGEAEFLQKHGAQIFAIDDDIKHRYERIANTEELGLAHISFEDFREIEEREMTSHEPWDTNVFEVMKLADKRIVNSGTLDELHSAIDQALMSVNEPS